MAVTRIKVGRQKLLDKLVIERDRLAAKYEEEKKQYARDVDAFLHQIEDDVESFIDQIAHCPDEAYARVARCGHRRDAGYLISFEGMGEPPREPSGNLGKIESLIRTLEMAEDEQISIASNDAYAAYL